jgi:hypothetical protein
LEIITLGRILANIAHEERSPPMLDSTLPKLPADTPKFVE